MPIKNQTTSNFAANHHSDENIGGHGCEEESGGENRRRNEWNTEARDESENPEDGSNEICEAWCKQNERAASPNHIASVDLEELTASDELDDVRESLTRRPSAKVVFRLKGTTV